MKTIFTIYQDKQHEWRWRAKRGRHIVADSGEGYRRKSSCQKTLVRFVESIASSRWAFQGVWNDQRPAQKP